MTSIQFNTDTMMNIYASRIKFAYNEATSDERATVSYIAHSVSPTKKVVETRANYTISVNDRSGSLTANRERDEDDIVIIKDIDFFSSRAAKVDITDVFVSIQGLKDPVPVFSKHIINTTNLPRVSSTDMTISSGYTLVLMELLDKKLSVVDNDNVSYDFDEGIIYNNLAPGYNVDTGIYSAYYVRYSVSDGSDVSTYIELINNQDVFAEATFDDLDEELNLVDDGTKKYFVTNTDDGYEILLPSKSTYAYKVKDKSRINIIKPGRLGMSVPWFVRISNGSFNAYVSEVPYRYLIAEFNDQQWNPEYPYKKITSERSVIVSDKLIKLNRENIYESSSDSLYIDVLINNVDGDGVAAFSTNPSNHGTTASNGATYYQYSNSNQTGIRSVDNTNGLLDVVGITLGSDYQIISSYYFEEKDYEFTEIDFNSINDTDILKQTVFLFVDPEKDIEDKTQTLYYGVADKKGKVIESNWSSFDNVAEALTTGENLYYEALPSFITDATAIIFIDDYTVEGDGKFLVLGDITVAPSTSASDATIADVRVRGGGIRENSLTAAREEDIEVDWYFDVGFWDTVIAYPANATYLVEVPVEIFSGAGGSFTQKRVKELVDKHTALGVYPVVKAYGVDPKITNVIPYATSIYLEWGSYGSDVSYNIYYSSDGESWTKANTSVIPDASTTNSGTITGLTTGVLYYVAVIGGKLVDGTWTELSGQSVGPVDIGVKEIDNPEVVVTRTFEAGA